MANNESTTHMEVEVVPQETSYSAQVGRDGSATVTKLPGDMSINMADDLTEDEENGLKDESGEESTETSAEETTEEDSGESTEGSEEELPDYSDDPEVLAKYDAKYSTQDDGGNPVINLDGFNDELAANVKEGRFDISENGRKYLKGSFGLSDTAIDNYLRGLKATSDEIDNAVFEGFGGEEAYKSTFEWAIQNYTQAQKDSYNAALKLARKGDTSALEEQNELMRVRHAKATGKPAGAQKPTRPTDRLRRPSSPARQVEARPAGGTAVEPFASPEDHRKALVEAGEDMKKIEVVRRRLRASSWYSAQG